MNAAAKRPSATDPSPEMNPVTGKPRSYTARMQKAPAPTAGVAAEAERNARNYVTMHGAVAAKEQADKIMFKKGRISGRDKANWQALVRASASKHTGFTKADLPKTADGDLREALDEGMDHSAVHRSKSGMWAVDNGDDSWSVFNKKGQLITDEAYHDQLPKDAWPSITDQIRRDQGTPSR